MAALTLLLVALLLLAGPAGAVTSINQYGIAFNFADDETCGQYVTGDFWCIGPVTLTSITPDTTGSGPDFRNGWTVNVTETQAQPFDGRSPDLATSLIPTLPYTAPGDTSIIKADSSENPLCSGDNPTCIDNYAILTIVSGPPPALSFRPAYAGTDKRSWNANDLRTQLLPSLNLIGLDTVPSLSDVEESMRRPCPDHYVTQSNRRSIRNNNCAAYGALYQLEVTDAILRSFGSESLADRLPLIRLIVQRGIDIWAMRQIGAQWTEGGGHGWGRKSLIAYAAALLDDPALYAAAGFSGVQIEGKYQEDRSVRFSPVAGRVLYGIPASELLYWSLEPNGCLAGFDTQDPYGYIDACGYHCCHPMTAAQLARDLFPEMGAAWQNPHFEPFVDRWMSFGIWAVPDPCTHTDPVTYTGQCVEGVSAERNEAAHGTNAAGGLYESLFGESAYQRFNCCADACACAGQVCSDGDGDGVPDKFDSCVLHPNSGVVGALDPARSYVYSGHGWQPDDDADGIGNACDCDFDNGASPVCTVQDINDAKSSLGQGLSGSTCGQSGSMSCGRFDMVAEPGITILTTNDVNKAKSMLGAVPSTLSCASLPTPCTQTCIGPGC